jgi:signal transduction histidine kinase/CheY-like chemotaxis protein
MSLLDIFAPPVITEQNANQLKRGESLHTEISLDFDHLINEHGFVTTHRKKAHLNIFFMNLGRDQYQEQSGFLVQVSDITALRENESALALRESQLLQAQKMESIGMMTGGIAHDFNNILTPILGYSEIGLELCEGNETLHEFINEIHIASLRAKELVTQILIYSRQSDDDASPIHLIPIVREVAKQQTSVLAPDIKVSCRIRSQNDLVHANPTQLHQVMTNLATNAAYAMRRDGGDKLDIQVTTFNMGWRHRQEFPTLSKGSYLRLTFKDNGPGIPEEIREKIFNPFFSTKPHGEGTGMGLAVVKGIVDAVGGGIAIESKEGEGATFHIALPLLEEQAEQDTREWNSHLESGHTVLFVDDETAIVKMAGHVLKSIGFKPLLCNTPQEVFALLKNKDTSVDIMITDYAMPEFTGTEMAIEANKLRPELPIMVLTGHPAEIDQEKCHDAGVRAILRKPASKDELERSISLVLQGRDLLKEALEEKTAPKPLELADDPEDGA